MDHECNRKRIPAFGNWDYANELPITQYFEWAREGGLLLPSRRPLISTTKPHRILTTSTTAHLQTKGSEKRCQCPATKHTKNDAVWGPQPRRRVVPSSRPPRPADEDLYQIPPELLHSVQRKKKLGIFSRCLVPCTA